MKKFIFVSVSMILLALTSCENENWIEWTPMSFVSEETTIDKSGNISIPAEGGTYHIRCTNYKLLALDYNSLRENDKERLPSNWKDPVKELKGEWTEVTMQDNVLTVLTREEKNANQKSIYILRGLLEV